MIFPPEYAEDIGSVCLLNQIFESVSDLFAKEISKRIVCVCINFLFLLIKRLRIAVFLLMKLEIKQTHHIQHFLDVLVLLETYLIFNKVSFLLASRRKKLFPKPEKQKNPGLQ